MKLVGDSDTESIGSSLIMSGSKRTGGTESSPGTSSGKKTKKERNSRLTFAELEFLNNLNPQPSWVKMAQVLNDKFGTEHSWQKCEAEFEVFFPDARPKETTNAEQAAEQVQALIATFERDMKKSVADLKRNVGDILSKQIDE